MMLFIFYVTLKLAAYIAWCRIGVGLFRPLDESKQASALKFGVVRLLLGVVFGTAVFLWVWKLNLGNWAISHIALYFLIYAPLRWIEWSIMGFLMQREAASLLIAPRKVYAASTVPMATSGPRLPGVLWKLGGILVSHVADLPIIIASGGVDYALPVGRFLC
jgi:hypothetical protein